MATATVQNFLMEIFHSLRLPPRDGPVLQRRLMDNDQDIIPGNPGRSAKVPDNSCVKFFLCLDTPACERDDLDNDKPVTLCW